MDEVQKRLLDVIRNKFDKVAYTHKAHEKERELASKRVCFEKRLRVILAMLTALVISTGVLSTKREILIFSTIIGIINGLYSIYALSIKPENRVYSHTIVAKHLLAERDNLMKLIEQCMSGEYSNNDIRTKLDVIGQRINSIESLAPYPSEKAYKAAVKSLSTGTEGASTQTEIDKLLPESFGLEKLESTGSTKSDG